WKFPHLGHECSAARPLLEQNRVIVQNEGIVENGLASRHLHATRFGATGSTQRSHRALFATRHTRKADHGAEFHERLIKVARTLAIEQGSGSGPAFVLPQRFAAQAGEHALDVAVDYRNGFSKCDAGYSVGGIAADTREFHQLERSLRE